MPIHSHLHAHYSGLDFKAKTSSKGMHVRFIFAVLLLFGILAGCSENGTENQSGARPTLVAIAPSTAIPSPMESTSLPTPVPTPTHTPAEAPSPSPALPVANTPTLPPAPTTEATGTLLPVEAASPTSTPQALPDTWRDLIVAPEYRCSPYDSDDYPYSQSVEKRIVEAMNGLIYGPYTGTHFENTRQTDIEHIVARSEAHDSGLCAADAETKKRFAYDLLNLTLASPEVNRHQKSGKDAAEWLPDLNQCWFADRVVQVRQEYKLTIDETEATALENVLSGCSSVDMVISDTSPSPSTATPYPTPVADALAMYDDNGNGRITCAEARAHGIAPVRSDHPAYPYMNDADGDGVVCE